MDLHIPPELEARLNQIAAETGRDADQVALELLSGSVEHDEWFRREVETGRTSAREGRLLDHGELPLGSNSDIGADARPLDDGCGRLCLSWANHEDSDALMMKPSSPFRGRSVGFRPK